MRSPIFALLTLCAALATGCAAVYPEIGTRLKAAPKDAVLDPGPPESMVWIRVVEATVPDKTRDGRRWDQVFGSLPDPYAKLLVEGKELFRTTVESNTLTPTWKDAIRGNFNIPVGTKMRVELWDNSLINDAPIGIKDFSRPSPASLLDGKYDLELKGGGHITIAFEPAHAMFGLGFWFELRNDSTFITRFVPGSPAERAGIEKGDEIVSIGGKKVAGMTPDDVRSLLNSVPVSGLDLELKRKETLVTVNVQDGPIYPTYDEYGPLE